MSSLKVQSPMAMFFRPSRAVKASGFDRALSALVAIPDVAKIDAEASPLSLGPCYGWLLRGKAVVPALIWSGCGHV